MTPYIWVLSAFFLFAGYVLGVSHAAYLSHKRRMRGARMMLEAGGGAAKLVERAIRTTLARRDPK